MNTVKEKVTSTDREWGKMEDSGKCLKQQKAAPTNDPSYPIRADAKPQMSDRDFRCS